MDSLVQRRRPASSSGPHGGLLEKPAVAGGSRGAHRRGSARAGSAAALATVALAAFAAGFLACYVFTAANRAAVGGGGEAAAAALRAFASRTIGATTTGRTGEADQRDPVWWLADEEDDFYEREYMSRDKLWHVRDIDRKIFFTGMCGYSRFNISGMPDMSVIVTVQNEQDGMLSLAVHSVLARTPPSLLREIIIIDDNGASPDIRGKVNETELDELKALPKVTIIHNTLREGCARSRMNGAHIAKGEVLMFIDSHIEMMSGTWAEHLLAPIVENPRTMALQTLDIISDLDHSYGNGSGDLLYGIVTDQFWFGYQRTRFFGQETEQPGRRLPYETPFGPGSLFAIRRDEFWRLGGYDKGLYVWGGENTELALKMWTCGGRMVMVPCSRVGHMYRIHVKEVGRWPPFLPQELTDRLGCGYPGRFLTNGSPADNFTKIITRNNIRIMETWVGDHPAKRGYYKHVLGSETLPPEWQQYADELATDPTAIEQREVRTRNKCRDFEWFDRHVYKKYVGVHHPWHPSIKEKTWV
jgi:GT2 family glycosyltransferase